MRPDLLELDATLPPPALPPRLGLEDAEAIRLLISGGSVIDWHKAAFKDLSSVDRLLGLHLLDMQDSTDRRRLRYLYNEAVTYVEEFRGMRMPAELRSPDDVREVFLWASDTQGFRRRQMLSCMTLKLMHVISHMEAADLKLRADVSEYDLQELAHHRVLEAAERMRLSPTPPVAFYGSRKTRASVIQKLIAKRDNVAATIFDKLRYRVLLRQGEDLLPALGWLLGNIIPLNHVIPGQTHNNLVDPSSIESALDPVEAAELQPLLDDPIRADTAKNEFSGRTYRMINFIAELPVRLPVGMLPPGDEVHHGRVVYVMIELQLVDEPTARANEQGDNSHDRYKDRQWERVKARLGRGAYVR